MARFSFTGSGCTARHPVRMAVVFAWMMDYGKFKGLQTWYPSCDHPLWLSEVAQPLQASMVSHDHKVSHCQISKQLYGHHDC